MKNSVLAIAGISALLWGATMVHDPRDAAAAGHAQKAATARHTAYPTDRFRSLDLCGGKTADIDFDRIRPDHPIRLRVLCQDQSQVQVTIR